MIRRLLVLTAAALALAGCVLQSRVPLFDDSSSVLALGDKGGGARVENFDKGKWVEEKEALTIDVVGKHYEAHSGKATVILNFVKLSASTFILQGRENDENAAYMIAQVKDGVAEVRPLACTDIKKDETLAKWVEYVKDDCFVKPGAPAQELFIALAKLPGDPTSRLTIILK